MAFSGKNIKDIHIGEMICSYLKKNLMTKKKFAEIMGIPMTNAMRLLSNKNIELNRLLEVSRKLQHNFIADICDEPQYVNFLDFDPLINIGNDIENRLKILKMTQVEFARAMNIHQSDVSKLLKKESIGTEKLLKICRVLDHNFFRELLPMDFSNKEVYDAALKDAAQLALDLVKDDLYRKLNEKDNEIFSLRNENHKLKSQISKLKIKNTELRKQLKLINLEEEKTDSL